MAEQKPEVDYENYFSNMSMDMLIRGDTIEEMNKLSLNWCRQFIGGSWLNAKTVDDIICTRLQGGQTNQLYKIELKSHVTRVPNKVYKDEPDKVAIKVYQKKHFVNFDIKEDSERLNDTIILTALSGLEICPKVYGIFDNGFIQEYFEVSFALWFDQLISNSFCSIARALRCQSPSRSRTAGTGTLSPCSNSQPQTTHP